MTFVDDRLNGLLCVRVLGLVRLVRLVMWSVVWVVSL